MELDAENLRRIEIHLLQSAETKRQTAEKCAESIAVAGTFLAEAFLAGGKLLLCGNGGSAADCQHMAAEFVSRLSPQFERRALPALALTTDTSFLTAFGNDCGFEGIFKRQVEALGSSGDVLLAISTSGNSANVLRAVEAARRREIRTIALTGSAGRLAELADVAIRVPSVDTQYIQETHLAVEHVLCELVEYILFKPGRESE
jgi:D-sedoheptulose 7-phosphate isomerase